MRFNQEWLTVKEFAQEVGLHYETVKKRIIRTGAVVFTRTGARGRIKIRRDWADKYHAAHTFGGQAYGR